MPEVILGRWRCRAVFSHYVEGSQPALLLLDAENDSPVAVASINLPGLQPGEVAVKDYNENEGMLAALEKAGLVAPPHRFARSGYVDVPICRLLVKPEEEE